MRNMAKIIKEGNRAITAAATRAVQAEQMVKGIREVIVENTRIIDDLVEAARIARNLKVIGIKQTAWCQELVDTAVKKKLWIVLSAERESALVGVYKDKAAAGSAIKAVFAPSNHRGERRTIRTWPDVQIDGVDKYQRILSVQYDWRARKPKPQPKARPKKSKRARRAK